MKRPAYKPWSETERATLIALYSTHGPDHVASVLERPRQGVRQQAMRLKLSFQPTPEQREEYARNAAEVRWAGHAKPEKTKAPCGRPTAFTPEVEAILRRVWPTATVVEAIEATGLSKTRLNIHATRLGLGRIGQARRKVKEVKEVKVKAPKPVKEAPGFRTTDFRSAGKKAPKPEPPKRGYHYPMNSPQYKEWEASLYEGRQAVSFIDSMNRPTTIYRKVA
ncbi:hypothetical protein [Hymenobacter guriensis]|uniref:Myb-like domain-containing protein n=1 Tax=Hymenobacter guriensis TaxID=2793065 RepID=A0ABS0KYQ0_9BACT|nr:hypothetical protein [Hymenobacter guriensis]MBG8552329.1 hypothetical protein [Hymenobacter guriensis]